MFQATVPARDILDFFMLDTLAAGGLNEDIEVRTVL